LALRKFFFRLQADCLFMSKNNAFGFESDFLFISVELFLLDNFLRRGTAIFFLCYVFGEHWFVSNIGSSPRRTA